MKTTLDCVLSVPDPRTGNHKKHNLGEMLFAALVSVVCGYDSYVAFARFTELNLEWLRGLGCAFANGVPSHDTFSRAFSVASRYASTCDGGTYFVTCRPFLVYWRQ